MAAELGESARIVGFQGDFLGDRSLRAVTVWDDVFRGTVQVFYNRPDVADIAVD